MKSDAEHRGWSLSPFSMAKFPEQAARANRRFFADEFFSFGSGLADGFR
jgi:hypothetical protein